MASKDQTIVLITGDIANGGIGFELTAQLLHDNKEKGSPARHKRCKSTLTTRRVIDSAQIFVEDKYGRLDALINNAAITGEEPTPASLPTCMNPAFLTNVTGLAVVVETFAPLLGKSEKMGKAPRIINVTSGAGSIGFGDDRRDPHRGMKVLPYRTCKAALNMLTACQAYEYGPKGWKVFCFCPRFTESNLGPMNKAEHGAKPTSEGAKPMVAILEGKRDEEHGGYLKAEGCWPW